MKVNRVILTLLWFLFVINLSEGLFAPLLAIYVTNELAGATLASVGFAVAIYAVVKSVFQLVIAKKLDKWIGERDDFYALVAGSLIGVAYAFGLAVITNVNQFYWLASLSGVGGACLMAAYYSIFARHADHGKEGFEWSLFSVGGLTISAAIGAAIGGVAIEHFGFSPTFVATGLLNAVATMLLLFLYPKLDIKRHA
ncbi:MAG: hypothetical protein A3D65_05320 [Candidatus Lloydbacteria bacterium RIFCSPHIGHO2_02_FULL_50_13]|uniref:Major facilitator superfamily (MFS) profile domain-containing protein n=1 Tax=Candidatus Lloydbacteria bacterium RIFCSPHIGHO2_02_FULL_50_13 TaxID=1798661 RepID=A0A1G2DAD1_9BACT|nr:MAG: hypothetical protein A3D65_05320 [Candidatus Lloydbacteria bacterium RIFCSPHIGHO2_02_FULL_50_13]